MDLVIHSDEVCDNENCLSTINSTALIDGEDSVLHLFFTIHKVLPCGRLCPYCYSVLKLKSASMRYYRCRKMLGARRVWGAGQPLGPQCNYTISEAKGTFFEGINLSKQQVLMFSAYWLRLPHPKQSLIMEELDMSSGTVVEWSHNCRQVCFAWLVANSTQVGGEGHIVELDEALVSKRKYERGRVSHGEWVFGGIDRNTKEVFLVPVASRDSATLVSLLTQWIRPGTTVITDFWSAIAPPGYFQFKVNHSVKFVDPDTDDHSHITMKTWKDVHGLVPRYKNKKHHLHGHFAEFLFKSKFAPNSRIHHFWCAVASLYPGSPLPPPPEEEYHPVNEDEATLSEGDSD